MAFLEQLIDDVVVNKFEINSSSLTIGRHPDSAIQINDSAISSSHAVITVEKSSFLEGSIELYVEDLNSKNGSFINGRKIQGRQQICNNDTLRFGWNEFKLQDADPQSLEATAHILQ